MNRILKDVIKFILSIFYIILFMEVFGKENILIALTTIIALYNNFYQYTNLSIKSKIIQFSLFYVYLGIAAYLSTINVILATGISFITIYYIAYNQFKVKGGITNIIFIVNYLFMLITPVYNERLLIRLAALVISTFSIVIVKEVTRRYIHPIEENYILLETINLLESKIEFINLSKETYKYDDKIKSNISEFIEKIYVDKFKFVVLEKFRKKLYITFILDKINYDLDKIRFNLDNKISNKKLEKIKVELKKIKEGILKEKKEIKNNNFDFSLEVEKSSISKKEYESIRISYSLRLAMGIGISVFIWKLFRLDLGIWIVLTVYALCRLNNEATFKERKDGAIGAILGIVFIILLYFICENILFRIIILVFIGYIVQFAKSYKEYVTYISVVVIGLAVINKNVLTLDGIRIKYILLGAIIALLLNHFFLPNDVQDISSKLIEIYDRILAELVIEKQKIFEGQARMEYIDALVLLSILLESKIIEETRWIKDDELEDYIERNHYLLLEIHDICRRTEEYNTLDSSKEKYNKVIKDNVCEILEGSYNINIVIKK